MRFLINEYVSMYAGVLLKSEPLLFDVNQDFIVQDNSRKDIKKMIPLLF